MNFEIEDIPIDTKLFYRIHKVYIDESINDEYKKIKPSAFDPQPKPKSTELSVNWDKYSTALQTKELARKPELNGVVSFEAKKIKSPEINLQVKHSPSVINRSHSIIFNVDYYENDPEIRIKLRRICKWEINI